MHLKNGPWATQGGYEDNLVLIAGLLALADGDPKELSLDRALGLSLTGSQWALAAHGVGAAASTAAIEMGRRSRPGGGHLASLRCPGRRRGPRHRSARTVTPRGAGAPSQATAAGDATPPAVRRRVTGSRRPRYSTRSMPG